MKPGRFDYAAPASLDETLGLLAEHGSDAKILAGGQSLVPLLNMRLALPELLVDINRLDGVTGLSLNGELRLGPLVRQAEVERDHQVTKQFPMLAEALSWVGHRQIRNRGTILGSLAHADPAAELPVAFLALEGRMKIAGENLERWVPASEFFVHIMETAIQPEEMLVEATVAPLPVGTGTAFLEVARRHGDFAVASAAIIVRVDIGALADIRISMGGVGPTPLRARSAELALLGAEPTAALFAEAARLAADETAPASDIHGTAEYRQDVIRHLVERGLAVAAERSHRNVQA